MNAKHWHLPLFTGQLTERFSESSAALERKLTEAGVTRQSLREQWGITLWSIRDKGDKIKLKAEAHRPVDEDALNRWFAAQLQTDRPIDLRIKNIESCCHKPCEGCLSGNPSKRKAWLG